MGILSDNGLNFVEVLTEIDMEAYKGGLFRSNHLFGLFLDVDFQGEQYAQHNQ